MANTATRRGSISSGAPGSVLGDTAPSATPAPAAVSPNGRGIGGVALATGIYRQYVRNEFRTSHGNRQANTSRPPSIHIDDFVRGVTDPLASAAAAVGPSSASASASVMQSAVATAAAAAGSLGSPTASSLPPAVAGSMPGLGIGGFPSAGIGLDGRGGGGVGLGGVDMVMGMGMGMDMGMGLNMNLGMAMPTGMGMNGGMSMGAGAGMRMGASSRAGMGTGVGIGMGVGGVGLASSMMSFEPSSGVRGIVPSGGGVSGPISMMRMPGATGGSGGGGAGGGNLAAARPQPARVDALRTNPLSAQSGNTPSGMHAVMAPSAASSMRFPSSPLRLGGDVYDAGTQLQQQHQPAMLMTHLAQNEDGRAAAALHEFLWYES
ncbi:hypothetical protein DFJ73DRAFT_212603 [Zopfochytrium polystomum]|nr:hypothetical protein DFJ73DRAFT_212603 [Zopfochytrium polystomum]